MRTRDFNKLLKRKTSDEILTDYMICKIYLTDKQLEKVCNNSSHHGGCNTKEVKK